MVVTSRARTTMFRRLGTWSGRRWLHQTTEKVPYDVCIVGGGPAGLSAAIRTKQLAAEMDKEVQVCVLDKGGDVGAHVLSGCVMDPRALNELLPDWMEKVKEALWRTDAKRDRLFYLTEKKSVRLPVIPQLNSKGCHIVSLSSLCRWMASQAEALGVDLFPGFAATTVLRKADGSIGGVRIRDRGVDKQGRRKPSYEQGIEIEAKATLLAEGCRGSISEEVMRLFHLRQDVEHQTYGLGIKEVWEVPETSHDEGCVMHSVGYPLRSSVYGGGFLYHMADRKVAVGLVAGLDYSNPYLSVFHEFQKFKSHPLIKGILDGGSCLQYGARALNEGGLQCIPQLNFPGGALIGCSAGFMNSLRLKGTHGAMKSGMLAAEALMQELGTTGDKSITMSDYPRRFQNSWLHEELRSVRNVRPGFRHGLYIGMASAFVHGSVLRGREPWTFKFRHEDCEALKPAKDFQPIPYTKPDQSLTFDIAASLFNSGTNHDHNQPPHLRVKNTDLMEQINVPVFDMPETRYCPAGVYEYVSDLDGNRKLQINAQNCLHCKACDIKDPMKNIQWTVPEGGDGPNYTLM